MKVLVFLLFLVVSLANSPLFSEDVLDKDAESLTSTKAEGLSESCDYIVASVEDQIITCSEIQQKLTPLEKHYREIYQGEKLEEKLKEAPQIMLEQLIQRRILKLKAEEAGVQVREDHIEAEVETLKKTYASPREFWQELEKYNLTLTKLKERIEEELRIRNFMRQYVAKGIRVSDQETKKYYQRYKDEYSSSSQVKISQILIRTSSPEEARKTAEEIWENLKAGEEFSTLAKKYSQGPYANQGGSLGFIHEEELPSQVRKALSSLKIGEYTRPIQSSSGYHIIRLEGKKLSKCPPLSEIEDKIRARIYKEKIDKAYLEWMEKAREEMDVTILGFR